MPFSLKLNCCHFVESRLIVLIWGWGSVPDYNCHQYELDTERHNNVQENVSDVCSLQDKTDTLWCPGPRIFAENAEYVHITHNITHCYTGNTVTSSRSWTQGGHCVMCPVSRLHWWRLCSVWQCECQCVTMWQYTEIVSGSCLHNVLSYGLHHVTLKCGLTGKNVSICDFNHCVLQLKSQWLH